MVKVELLMRTCIYALLCLALHTFAATIEGRVVGVADGDTITVLDADKVQRFESGASPVLAQKKSATV